MSYIGANPSADDIRLSGTAGIRSAALLQLTVSATDPGSPAEGMVYYNDGSGTISEGLKVYKNGNFVSLDSQEGDADTLQLLQAKDQPAIKFNAAISSTSVIGNTLAVPTPTSTGTGGVGTFDVPTTGSDALMSNVDASRVFKYISHSTNDSKSDYWGVPLAIPKAFRGENIVLSFVYRTVTTSTTAMSDGQFKVYIQDKTNGKSVTSTTTTGTGTPVAAGANINVSDRTGIGVGDLVYIESGTGNAGAAANSITEAYVTSIDGSTGAGNITVSQSVRMPATAGGRIVTKLLSDLTVGGIDAAPSTTGSGKMKKIQFTPESTTGEVYVWFQNTASTGSTKIDTLFYDQFLISSNKFLQVQHQDINSQSYEILQSTSSMTNLAGEIEFNLSTATITQSGSTSLFEVVDDSSNTRTKFIALKDCNIVATCHQVAGGEFISTIGKNGSFYAAGNQAAKVGGYRTSVSAPVRMVAGDYITFASSTALSSNASDWANGSVTSDAQPTTIEIVATSAINNSVVLESQEEIFSEWTAYTPTITGGTSSNIQMYWRRVTGNMEIRGRYTIGTRSSTEEISFTLPSGYEIDTNIAGLGDLSQFGLWSYVDQNFYVTSDSRTGYGIYNGVDKDKVYYATKALSTTTAWETRTGTAEFGDDNRNLIMQLSIPILGWSSKFTPLLSMPLVDFGSFSNTYSAKITNGGTAAIASQSESFISSVSRTGTGIVVVTFNSGHFAQAPAISVAGDTDSATNELLVSVDALSASACTIRCANDAGVEVDGDFWLMFQRQGADFKQPPQPTAAVIKPSVAFVKDVKAYNVDGGATGTATTWHTRTLNTIEGESWFINSLSANVVTLQPGQYEIEAVQNMSSAIDVWTTRLYNTTNSTTLANGSTNVCAAQAAYPNSHAKWAGTFTVATGVRLDYIVETAGTSGNSLGLKSQDAGSTEDSIYSQVKITKLK